MNQLIKIIVAILGGVNEAFKIFVPITLVLMAIAMFDVGLFNTYVLICVGLMSSLFRAIKPFII